jgi:hypothetical protein
VTLGLVKPAGARLAYTPLVGNLFVFDLVRRGGWLYAHQWDMDSGDSSVTAYDVTDPASPRPAGSIETWEAGQLVDGGTRLWQFSGYGEVGAIDISDPANPVDAGWIYIETENCWGLRGIAARDGMVYGFGEGGCMLAVDATNLEEPEVLGSLTGLTIDLYGMPPARLVGDRLFAGGGHVGGWLVIDVARPSAPELVASRAGLSAADCAAWTGDRAVVGGSGETFTVLDASGPGLPHQGASVAVEDLDHYYGCAIGMEGRTAGLVRAGSFLSLDLSSANAPRELARRALGGVANDVQVQGGVAYVASPAAGVEWFSAAGGGQSFALQVPGWAVSASAIGPRLYVLEHGVGAVLTAVDLANPNAPVELGTLELGGEPVMLRADSSGALALVSDTGPMDRLVAVDTSNPARMFVTSTAAVPDEPRTMSVAGGLAYVSAPGQVVAIDVSNRRRLAPAGRIPIAGGVAATIAASGDRLLLGYALGGVEVVQVAR